MIQIAIDGGAATGKTTIARLLAKKLNYLFINSGFLYRIFTKVASENNWIDDLEKVVNYFNLNHLSLINEVYQTKNVKFIEQDLITKNIIENVSKVASNVFVRNKINEILRQIATNNNCVMEGRDIGSVVLPNAKYKFFLTVNDNEAAKRRMNENNSKGINISFEEILANIKSRNLIDSTRNINPLVKPKNAIEIDTSDKSVEQIVNILESVIKNGTI